MRAQAHNSQDNENVSFEDRPTSKFREDFTGYNRSSFKETSRNSQSPQRTARKQIFSRAEVIDPDVSLPVKDLKPVRVSPIRVEKSSRAPVSTSAHQSALAVDDPHFENMLLKKEIENLKTQVEHAQRYIRLLRELTKQEFNDELDPISAINLNSARHGDELTVVRLIERQKEHFELEYRKAQAEIKQLTEEKAAIIRDYQMHSQSIPPRQDSENPAVVSSTEFNSCHKEGFWQKMYKRKAEEVDDLMKQLEHQKAQHQKEKAALLAQVESLKLKS